MSDKFKKLINVKSFVTILTTIVFCFLSCKNSITPEMFLTIFTIIIGFYFGTQSNKKDSNNDD